MPTDFLIEYSQRSDDELLHLASQRHFLTEEAVAALETELRRRNLTQSDLVKHQKFVKRQQRRQGKRRRWKIDPLKDRLTWLDILCVFTTMAVVAFSYISLPSRFHLKPEWQDAAFIALVTSVLIAFGSRGVFRRTFGFWMSLTMSSAVQLVGIHAWTQRVPNLKRAELKLALLLGLVLFLAVYGFIRFLQRTVLGEEVQTTRTGHSFTRS